MNKSFVAAVIASTLIGGAAFAGSTVSSPNQNTFSLEIRGFVPVICRASVSATQVSTQPGQVSLGQLNQFCNDPNGYQVWVDYSPQMAGASLVVDGNQVNLSSSGSTMIDTSNLPSIEAHDLALNLPTGTANGSLSIRVVAL